MIHLLDTDTLIFMIRGLKAGTKQRGRRARALTLVQRCQQSQLAGDTVAVSAITVSELEFGARNSDSYDEEMEAVRKILRPFEIYDYDAVNCPVHYGRVRYELQSAGRPIESMDLLIAAHALSLNAMLVTNNDGHFSRVTGLRVANWSKP